ncbi:MAG: ATPase subunit of ABC transporter with duplicated ATPase domains [Flavobacteriales bacterium]|jgi:ATPase subunit of ABC transporter with duplicated ATPase domains
MIQFDNVSKYHGRQILYEGAAFSVFKGEKVALVGPNGSGKSTVFRLLVGEEEADAGNVGIEKLAKVGYFDQQVGEMHGRSAVAEAMAGAGEVSEMGTELAELEAAMADPERGDELNRLVDRYGQVQARFQELDGYSLEARAQEILAGLGFRQEMMDGDVGALSGGWKMRVALARILLMQPDVLLLDEPTNHLDIESIIWLESFLKGFAGALIITSHDREFSNRLVSRVLDINGGTINSYSGNYDFYEEQRALADVHAEAAYNKQQAMLAKDEQFIARFKARASHASLVQSRVKKLNKIDRIDAPRRVEPTPFRFDPPPRSGDDVVLMKQVGKAYGDLQVIDDLDWHVRRTERWCIMGVNGAGKSTLLKLAIGQLDPTDGAARLGASIKLGYFAQHTMELLNGDHTVYESLENAHPLASIGSIRNLAGAFGFPGDDVEKPIRILSGGEKARVVLAQMLYDPPNVLVLDEPTNHLDLDTKAMLIKTLEAYTGTMIMVSHDRAFLSALSTHVMELDGLGSQTFEGGYTEYVTLSGHEAPGVG